MKDIVQCIRCSKCAIQQSTGLINEMIYRCSAWKYRRVDEDDGCTMGIKGEPRTYPREEIDPILAHRSNRA